MERRDRDDRRQHKSVATRSSVLTDRKYVMRQPLFSGQHHTSILKKENHLTVFSTPDVKEAVREKVANMSGVEPGLKLFRGPGTDPDAQTLSGLDKEEAPTLRSPRWSSSCSTLEVQRLNLPLRPQLTSTVLHPTYTSKYRRVQTDPWIRSNRLSSSAVQLEGRTETNHQRNYWACAIPLAPPPSPDRQSADWAPNTEYQDLLDYTYPLRAGLSEEVISCVWPPKANLQDSGIELDRLCSSIRSLDDLSGGTVSPAQPPDGLWDSLLSGPETNRCSQQGLSTSSHTPIRSSSLLPKSRTTGGDLHEEFWLLPDHLEELHSLAQQVNEVSSLLECVTPVSCSLPAEKVWTSPMQEQVENLVEKLCSAALRRQQEEQNYSLMEHIQIFCSHLQQLIRWLHTISEKKAALTPPVLDLGGVRQSLAEYQSFQREVGLHEPLTTTVLKSGRLLLSCISNTCPEIRDTLLLIERQSTVLENQAQQLLSSILSAVDTLTQPSGLDLQVKVDQDCSSATTHLYET